MINETIDLISNGFLHQPDIRNRCTDRDSGRGCAESRAGLNEVRLHTQGNPTESPLFIIRQIAVFKDHLNGFSGFSANRNNPSHFVMLRKRIFATFVQKAPGITSK